MAESSSAAPPPKPVVVRVKRKPFQSPVDAFWLEINERPLKRPLLDFGNLSISDSAQKVEFHNKKVFVQHVETISSSEVTFDTVKSFMDPGTTGASNTRSKMEQRKHFFKKDNKQDQLLLKAKQEKESLAKDARFEQIWKSRKGNKGAEQEKALQEICHLYDIVRVDIEENSKQEEEISLEDQKLLSSYVPLLREFIPNAAEEIEADVHAEDYVYDIYTVNEETDMNAGDSSYSYPLRVFFCLLLVFISVSSCFLTLIFWFRVQVDNVDDDFYDGPEYSDYESDDSNAENNPLNEYPDESSEEEEEEEEDSEAESEEREHGNDSDEPSEDDVEHKHLYRGDPLYDDDYDYYDERLCSRDVEDDYDDEW